jgi:hypothetical protein
VVVGETAETGDDGAEHSVPLDVDERRRRAGSGMMA